MSRTVTIALAAVLLAYVGSYIAFRQSHIEIWQRDNQAYVIFPPGAGGALYYLWRPLSYLDGTLTGMRAHIGSHQ